MKIAVLFSGGKDSTFTLNYYMQKGWDIECLITILPSIKDSWMFQNSSKEIIEMQAEALGIPVVLQKTKGEKEKELVDLEKAIKKAKEKYPIEGVAAGALASNYQRERVKKICDKLKLKCFTPFWQKDQAELLKEIICFGFEVRMVKVAAEGLSKEWLGKVLTEEDVEKLKILHEKIGLHVGGEGGEFETIVCDGPIFKKKIEILESEKKMENDFCGELIIKKLQLK